ncbi:MAG: helix-turn-helix domain-containing protein, partial [Turicibacter sp.]
GALKRLIFYATINNSDFTIELANEALRDLYRTEQKNSKIDVNNIIKEVGSYYDVSVSDILSKKRKKNIAFARQVAMFLTRELTGSSFPKIGDAFSGRDHTTIMHGCEKIEKEKKENPEVKAAIDQIKQNLS